MLSFQAAKVPTIAVLITSASAIEFEGNSVLQFQYISLSVTQNPSFLHSELIVYALSPPALLNESRSLCGDSHPAPRRLYAPLIELIPNVNFSLPALLPCYFYAAAYSGGLRNRTSNTSTRGQSPRVVSPSGSAWPLPSHPPYHYLNITTIEGKGAPCGASLKCRRPRINLSSALW